MAPDPIRTIIVDDEELGRQSVREILRADERFEIVAESGGGEDAIRRVRALSPDLLFLDIQMPEVDGFDVLMSLGNDAPVTVMVTAFDHYAIRAFDHHAMDYVLKPVDPERFGQTLDRAILRVQERRAGRRNEALTKLLADLDPSQPAYDRIVLKAQGAFLCLDPDELQWVESAGNYVKLHVGEQTYLQRGTMAEMDRRLDPARFVRIHRAFIVNIREVREVRADRSAGECAAILRDGAELAVGRSYRDALLARLQPDP